MMVDFSVQPSSVPLSGVWWLWTEQRVFSHPPVVGGDKEALCSCISIFINLEKKKKKIGQLQSPDVEK